MPTPSPISTPRLADHVRVCRFDDQMIFLDLLRGRYIGMAGTHVGALSAVVCKDSTATNIPAPTTDRLLHAAVERLREQQLLSDMPAQRPKGQSPMVIEPITSLSADDARESAQADWRTLLRLWRATLVVTLWLRHRSLFDIVNRIMALRARHGAAQANAEDPAMLAAVASYMRLRPLALTSHDRCLKDSLTLILFLASRGLFPQWVVGVRIHPFGAHSWVQSQGVVLNDLAERVRHYQAILVV